MNKLEWLNAEILKEYKGGDPERRVFLQTLKAALQMKEKEKGQLSESDETQLFKNELKQRQQAREEYVSGGRNDLVAKIDKEIAELKGMLPEEMSGEKIEEIVRKVYESAEDKSFGSIMKSAMAELQGQADGALVSQVVKKIIG